MLKVLLKLPAIQHATARIKRLHVFFARCGALSRYSVFNYRGISIYGKVPMGKPQFRSTASNLKYSFTSAFVVFVSIKTVLVYPRVENSKKYIINFFRIAKEAKLAVVAGKTEKMTAPNNPIEIAILKFTPNT